MMQMTMQVNLVPVRLTMLLRRTPMPLASRQVELVARAGPEGSRGPRLQRAMTTPMPLLQTITHHSTEHLFQAIEDLVQLLVKSGAGPLSLKFLMKMIINHKVHSLVWQTKIVTLLPILVEVIDEEHNYYELK